MSEFKPSDFARLGSPSCSRWGKSEIEWVALAYVQALTNDGDEWKRLTKAQVLALLSDEQKRAVHYFLEDDYYNHWFESVRDQITDSDGALGVRGFWDAHRLARATAREGGEQA